MKPLFRLKISKTPLYQKIWPVINLIPPELAHEIGLLALRLPMRLSSGSRRQEDVFERQGLRFRNRVGIAAGFDKNAACLPGIERLGAGFVEVGTIVVEPWKGLQAHPRLKRLPNKQAIWNRLGFPSVGLEKVKRRLAAFPREKRQGMLVACNIGPHPGHLRYAKNLHQYLNITAAHLLHLAETLFEHADFFVVNLSSPNTSGLRGLLQSAELVQDVLLPVKQKLREMDEKQERTSRTLLLVKIPPENLDRSLWSVDSLMSVIGPLLDRAACDGFVATNTSSLLAQEHSPLRAGDSLPEFTGGLSGSPLREPALKTVRLLRKGVGKDVLIIGSGGIMAPNHVLEFLEAGADLVEIYTGLIYHGPSFVKECASASLPSNMQS